MVDKAVEACDMAAEGVVLWDEVLVKTTSPEDLHMRCKELCRNRGRLCFCLGYKLPR